MNLYLHQVEPHISGNDSIYDPPGSERFDVVLTNPPFGTKGANQAPTRDDFVIETSNKQLNFIQHVMTILKPGGRAAVVVPDNVLQAGEVLKVLSEDCDLHTVLRLPGGTFSPYSPGTRTNVIFFTKGRPTENVWIYDARSNVQTITKKDRPLLTGHFAGFEECYGADPFGRAHRTREASHDDRWRDFSLAQVVERQYNLEGLKWLHDYLGDEDGELPEPQQLLDEALHELHKAAEDIANIQHLLAATESVE